MDRCGYKPDLRTPGLRHSAFLHRSSALKRIVRDIKRCRKMCYQLKIITGSVTTVIRRYRANRCPTNQSCIFHPSAKALQMVSYPHNRALKIRQVRASASAQASLEEITVSVTAHAVWRTSHNIKESNLAWSLAQTYKIKLFQKPTKRNRMCSMPCSVRCKRDGGPVCWPTQASTPTCRNGGGSVMLRGYSWGHDDSQSPEGWLRISAWRR